MRSRTLAILVGLVVALTPYQAVAADDVGTVSSASQETSDQASEAKGRALQEYAANAGALGAYVDDASGKLVLVLPDKARGAFNAVDAARFGVPFETVATSLDQTTIDVIEARLLALHADIGAAGFSYSFGPDLAVGAVAVRSDAPRSAFESVMSEFPGLVTYTTAVVRPTGWSNDTSPYKGGAWVQSSQKSCTSGWAMENASGTRWMVTAGHCFPNGVSTNMGTSIRDDGYTNWGIDVARLRAKSYTGKIYVNSVDTRAINDGNDPVVGSSYCIAGRTSGFTCSWKVLALNHSACYPNEPCFQHLAALKRTTSGVVVVQPGDSGGPLYINGATKVGIRGIVSGQTLVDSANPGNWTTLVQQYHSIADFYVAHVVTQ